MNSPLTRLAIGRKIRRAIAIYQASGWRGLKDQSRAYLIRWIRKDKAYRNWIRQYDTLTDSDRSAIRLRIEQFAHRPVISIALPVYNVADEWLRRAIESVRSQLYPNWELCIADDCSTLPHIRPLLEQYAREDSRIRVMFRSQNGHISAASNSALALATGEFTALMDHDDELTEHALYYLAEEIQACPDADLFYSDEDMIDSKGQRFDPKFKPDWSPDLFYSLNLLTHLIVYRTELIRRLGGFRLGFEGSQDYDLALRAIEQIPDSRIRHIPRILYHWRSIPGSVAYGAGEKEYAHERARQAIREHFQRRGIQAKVTEAPGSLHRIIYSLPDPPPMVSVIMFANSHIKQFGSMIEEILIQTDYPLIELCVIVPAWLADIEKEIAATLPSDARLIVRRADAASVAAAYNEAAQKAHGSVLCFLSGTTHLISSDWLKEMVSHALRPEVGAVGALILGPDNRVRNGGIIMGMRGHVGYAHRRSAAGAIGHLMRLLVIQNLSAVSAACMAIRRDAFAAACGFDAEHFPNGYGDVDLCLRLEKKGFRIVWTPYARVGQFDPADAMEGFDLRWADSVENKRLHERWPSILANDPHYNPNLTLEREDFSLASPPRQQPPWKAL
jgi:O-antigen biosynthesis protein